MVTLLLFLATLIWALPGLGMELLPVDAIARDPKYQECEQKLTKEGWKFKIKEGSIQLWAPQDAIAWEVKGKSVKDALESMEQKYIYYSLIKQHALLNETVDSTLQGLCILVIAREYKNKNEKMIEAVSFLREDLAVEIELFAHFGRKTWLNTDDELSDE